ncbi:MAG: M20/M25/M40 family metallo-hydrolase [Armatimonadetes bacterium]|nr:M20/M25/M40 family metallo-hydrolase [Armatimonadota bacterium]
MINEERLVDLFLNLCKINAPALQERDVIEWTKTYLTEHGLEFVEDEASKAIGGNANNIIVKVPGTLPDAPKIYLSAHFDTVEPTAGIVIEEIDGVFLSTSDTILGADDKGGMAPAIEAVLTLRESGEPHGDIYLLLTVAEEIGLKGAGALKIEDLGLDFGYVLDTGPPVGSYVTRTANHDKLDITVKGKPAHAGKDPENGINAIKVVADAVEGMRIGRIDPETTANLGTIHGGTGANVVCAEVTIKAEARSTNLQTLDDQIAHMKQRFVDAATKWGAEVEFNYVRHYSAYNIDPESMVVQVAQEASRNLGLDPELRTTLGGSDANIFNAKGVPSIVVATGMQKIHTHDEFISRADLVKTAELSLEILRVSAKASRKAG